MEQRTHLLLYLALVLVTSMACKDDEAIAPGGLEQPLENCINPLRYDSNQVPDCPLYDSSNYCISRIGNRAFLEDSTYAYFPYSCNQNKRLQFINEAGETLEFKIDAYLHDVFNTRYHDHNECPDNDQLELICYFSEKLEVVLISQSEDFADLIFSVRGVKTDIPNTLDSIGNFQDIRVQEKVKTSEFSYYYLPIYYHIIDAHFAVNPYFTVYELADRKYEKVYFDNNLISKVYRSIYYNKDYGIVGFRDASGNSWILNRLMD